MSIKCIIVEDEPLAGQKLKSYISKLPYLKLIACFDNAIEALAFLKENDVQLIFLDIHMDELSGIQLLESLQKRPEVIFTTAHDQHALKAFELNAAGYLLKPFSFDRFMKAINRVYDVLVNTQPTDLKFIFIKTDYKLEKISLEDILFIEGMRDYRRVHTKVKQLMTLQTFGELEQQLPAQLFCRIHKSFLISLDKIESIERDRVKIGNELLPVSVSYKELFYRRLGLRN